MPRDQNIIQENYFLSPEFLAKEQEFFKSSNFTKITEEKDGVIIDVPYARNDNFCGIKLYSHPFIYAHQDTYQYLKILVKNLNEEGVKVKIFDGYRPYKIQAFMAEKFPDFAEDGYVSHPINGIATHVRGIALDITLIKDGVELDMGMAFDSMSTKAHYIAKGLTEVQINNRKLLRDHMIKAGFEPFEKEWWHFNLPIFDKDKSGEIIGALEKEDKKYPKILDDFFELCSQEINEFYSKKILKYPNQPTAKNNPNKSCCCSFYKALTSFKKYFKTSNVK